MARVTGMPMEKDIFVQGLARRIGDYIREHGLLDGARRVVVGVSGGPDSVCLLYALNYLKDELGLDLHVAHLNHGLRGDEAAADSRYVAGMAGRLGLPCTLGRDDVYARKEKYRKTLEEAAREARYEFLFKVADDIGASHIAVGHTADDNVETILMHLIRGSGTRGLAGLDSATERHFDGRPYRTPCTIPNPPARTHRVVFKQNGFPDVVVGDIDFATQREVVGSWPPLPADQPESNVANRP